MPTTEECIAEDVSHGVWVDVGRLVKQEMNHQFRKWGAQDHDPETWWLIVSEEDGESAKSILEGDLIGAEQEIVQAIACRVRLIEKLRRQLSQM